VPTWGDWIEPDRSSPRLELIFGRQPFGANTACGSIHHGPIPRGSRCVCMVCHRSGLDGLPVVDQDKHDGDGQLREGYEVAGTPTKLEPPKLGLRGGK
jgi:hypothetical protein